VEGEYAVSVRAQRKLLWMLECAVLCCVAVGTVLWTVTELAKALTQNLFNTEQAMVSHQCCCFAEACSYESQLSVAQHTAGSQGCWTVLCCFCGDALTRGVVGKTEMAKSLNQFIIQQATVSHQQHCCARFVCLVHMC
jgi:hypothetical protein